MDGMDARRLVPLAWDAALPNVRTCHSESV